MDRLQKKCFVVSASLHLLLALILVVGPAFLSSNHPSSDFQELTFIPDKLIDADRAGGGNPNVRPPAAAPTLPPPVTQARPPAPPPPQPERLPETPAPKETRNNAPDPDSLEVAKDRTPKKPEISTKLVTRKPSSQLAKADLDKEAQLQERQRLEDRRRLMNQIGRTAESIHDSTAPPTAVGELGPGGGGPSYASYKAWVQTVYLDAWVPPDDITSVAVIAYADVTIAKDGTIISAKIVTRSGDSQVDSSVQRTLDRVTTIGRPFPEGAKESERTYKLKFDLKTKRGTA
ncbi:MAG TPA: TonB C-terminal domain-containing protein [Candidatus Acidoferrum sp.]|jgi:outer membrane biosynthesis protein TonB|nr:TonB C-terminal domain-containing protein [Candidatus Acidoferrum sp.]